MIFEAGSMVKNVALIATFSKDGDANIASPSCRDFRYTSSMMKTHQWVAEALEHSGLSGSELSRRLLEHLGRKTEDRTIVGKMMKDPATKGGIKPRKTSLDELIAISVLTGYPLPESLRHHALSSDARSKISDDDVSRAVRISALSDDQQKLVDQYIALLEKSELKGHQ